MLTVGVLYLLALLSFRLIVFKSIQQHPLGVRVSVGGMETFNTKAKTIKKIYMSYKHTLRVGI